MKCPYCGSVDAEDLVLGQSCQECGESWAEPWQVRVFCAAPEEIIVFGCDAVGRSLGIQQAAHTRQVLLSGDLRLARERAKREAAR